jgi:hypothetical protein
MYTQLLMYVYTLFTLMQVMYTVVPLYTSVYADVSVHTYLIYSNTM